MNFKPFLENLSPIQRFRQEIEKYGWKYEAPNINNETNPNAITNGATFPTFVSPDGNVKIALSTNDIYSYKGRILDADAWDTPEGQLTLSAFITDEKVRGQGLGTNALKFLHSIADNLGIKLVAQPVRIQKFAGKKSLITQKLDSWYKKHGWKDREPGIIQYSPK